MKRSLISLGVAACCLVFASGALADGPRHHHRGSDRGHYSHRHDAHHGKHRHHSDDRRGRAAPGWHRGPPPHAARHMRHAPRWERGARIPPRYRHSRYVVHDWHRHKFSRPPRGYQWVNVGTDYLLVGIATGVILQAVLRN